MNDITILFRGKKVYTPEF